MTRVQFYVLPGTDLDALLRTACRIAEKAWQQELAVYLHAESESMAQRLDECLWTFREQSFLPHCLVSGDDPPQGANPILIGFSPDHVQGAGLLINLAPPVPAFFASFERVADIIDADPQRRQAGRDRFRFYREQGCEPETHTL